MTTPEYRGTDYSALADKIVAPLHSLKVRHDQSPENEIIINAVWCDIGGHKAHEDEMRFSEDASVCYECYDHFTE